MSVTKCAEILNVSPQFVRIGLQRGTLKVGSAVKMSSRWTYHISPKLVYDYIGK